MTYNEALQADPLKFAKRYCLKGDNDARRPAARQGVIDGFVYSKMRRLSKISYLDCQRASIATNLLPRDASSTLRARAQNEGADTIVVTTHGPGAGRVPAWFLPWDASGGTVSLSIPSMIKFDLGFWGANTNLGGGSGSDPRIITKYPTFFLTAAINGCSVFVNGSAQEPKIYHSGSGGNIEGDAIEIWRDMTMKIIGGAPAVEVNKSHYVKDGSKTAGGLNTTKTTNKFEDALNKYYENSPVQIKEVRPWGAVFGTCNSFGSWAFYLQENATIRYDVLDKKKVFHKQTFQSFSVSRPMSVRQIFPDGGGAARMRSQFGWRPL